VQAWPQIVKGFGQAVEVVLELLDSDEELMEPELVG
jgi:hypothetical protein